jgi:2'-5' RNA ligase
VAPQWRGGKGLVEVGTEQGNWFVALVVPEQAGLHRLSAGLPPGLRRFQPGDLHLTLAFLGPCGAERAQRAWQVIADQPQSAITAEAGSWRAMGRPERPSAYVLTLGQGAQLAAGLIERWRPLLLEAAGQLEGHRHVLPHITLARPRRRLDPDEAVATHDAMTAWMRATPVSPGNFALQEVGLYRWAEDRSQRLFVIDQRRRLDLGRVC